eukprot:454734-Prymnesium_polylepis.1
MSHRAAVANKPRQCVRVTRLTWGRCRVSRHPPAGRQSRTRATFSSAMAGGRRTTPTALWTRALLQGTNRLPGR